MMPVQEQSACRQIFLPVLLFLMLYSSLLFAYEERNYLSTAFPPETVKQVLVARADFHPFPTIDEREAWDTLPEKLKNALLQKGETGLSYEWPSLPATLFLEYARNGNRSNYQAKRSARRNMLANLVLAECVEDKGRFLNDIVNGIWTICEESYWGVPAHISMQKAGTGLPDVTEPTVDLFSAETAALLSWTSYLLGDKLDTVSPLVKPRIELELQKRVLTPNLERDDFWWMGFGKRRTVNNWNPWINSNWLTTVLLMEKDENRRQRAVTKILRSLDKFINGYPADGGCDEGPGYWTRAGASLFDCLELLHSASNGKIDLYRQPLIQDMGRYIYRVHIYDRYFINFADASAKVSLPRDLVYRFGKRIKDQAMMDLGIFFAGKNLVNQAIGGSIGRRLPAIFDLHELSGKQAAPPYLRDSWFPQLQVLAARSFSGSAKGLYLAAKGGHNAESHNHNDVGNFIIYLDGEPMIIDAGVGTYTRKTFSSRRYEIWTMQSAYHNLPTINGVMQAPGKKFEAKNVSAKIENSYSQMDLDIAGAYPQEAGLKFWKRKIRLNRAKNIRISDSYQLNTSAKKITMTLMTPCQVTQAGKGKLLLNNSQTGKQLHVNFPGKMKVKTEEIKIDDRRLQNVWGNRLFRVLLTIETPKTNDHWDITFTK